MSLDGFAALIGLGYEIGFKPGIERKKRLEEAARARKAQREADERNSLTSRMKDARRAGLHPLVGLGAGFAPSQSSYVPGDTEAPDIAPHLYRAASAYKDQGEKNLEALTIRSAELSVQNQELDNALKASQLQRMNTSPSIPNWNGSDSPMSGQGDSRVKMMPAEIIASQSGSPAGEAGAVTDFGYSKTAQGGLAVIPSSDVKTKIEDTLIPESQWIARNIHLFSKPPYPGKEYDRLLPKGYDHWVWIPTVQEWRPANKQSVLGFREGGRLGPFVDIPHEPVKTRTNKFGPKY